MTSSSDNAGLRITLNGGHLTSTEDHSTQGQNSLTDDQVISSVDRLRDLNSSRGGTVRSGPNISNGDRARPDKNSSIVGHRLREIPSHGIIAHRGSQMFTHLHRLHFHVATLLLPAYPVLNLNVAGNRVFDFESLNLFLLPLDGNREEAF